MYCHQSRHQTELSTTVIADVEWFPTQNGGSCKWQFCLLSVIVEHFDHNDFWQKHLPGPTQVGNAKAVKIWFFSRYPSEQLVHPYIAGISVACCKSSTYQLMLFNYSSVFSKMLSQFWDVGWIIIALLVRETKKRRYWIRSGIQKDIASIAYNIGEVVVQWIQFIGARACFW